MVSHYEFVYVYGYFAYIYVCAPHVCSAEKDLKTVLEPLQLKL